VANVSVSRAKTGCAVVTFVVVALIVGAAVRLAVVNNPARVSIPSHPVPRDNGWDYFARASDALVKINHPGPLSSAKDPAQWQMVDYEAFVKANAPALALFREGLGKPCVSPPVPHLRQVNNLTTLYSTFRELGRTLCGEAMYYQKRGKYGRALDSRLDCVELGVSLPNQGNYALCLVAASVVRLGVLGPFESTGYTGAGSIDVYIQKANRSDLARAAERLERIRKDMTPFSGIVLSESETTATEFVEMLGDPTYRHAFSNPLLWPRQARRARSNRDLSLPAAFIKGGGYALADKQRIVTDYLAYANVLAKETQRPHTGRPSATTPPNLLAEELRDGANDYWKYHLQAEALVLLVQTEIALQRYNLENGSYPARLDKLVPRYLKAVPIDPFGVGKPLRYKPLDGGKSFLLYSVGGNMTDDGGKPSPHKYDWQNGDMLL